MIKLSFMKSLKYSFYFLNAMLLFFTTKVHAQEENHFYPFVKESTPALSLRGKSVVSSGDYIYFSSPDGIVIQQYRNAGWSNVGFISDPDPTMKEFGITLHLKDNFLFVGATNASDQGDNAEKVYVYNVDGANYSLLQIIERPAGTSLKGFGISIDCDGARLIIGASMLSDSYNEEAVLVYQLNNSIWSLEQVLYEPVHGFGAGSDARNRFGYFDIATTEDLILISHNTPRDEVSGNLQPSQVLVYRKNVNSWELVQTLESNGFLGVTIKIQDDKCLIGDHAKNTIHEYNINSASASAVLTLSQSITRPEYFGHRFDFNGRLLVSSGGEVAFIYEYINGSWVYKRAVPCRNTESIVVRDDFIIIQSGNSLSQEGTLYIYGLYAVGDQVCYNQQASPAVMTLSSSFGHLENYDASSEEVEIRWYEDEASTTPIAYGNPFVTGQLTTSRDYFVEADFYELLSPVRQKVSVCVAPSNNLSLTTFPEKEVYQIDERVEFRVSPPSYGTYDYGDGSTGDTDYHYYDSPGSYTVTFTVVKGPCTSCTYTVSTTVKVVGPLCEFYIPAMTSGQFKMDKLTGNVVYEREDCPSELSVSCMQGPAEPIPNVISADAVTFSDEWSYQPLYFDNYGTDPWESNTYETGTRGKWRVESSHVFNTDEIDRDKNYNTGTFPLTTFNWKYPHVSEAKGWIKSSTMEHYSPHGDALQERNALGIASVAKFGYHHALPYLTAQNAAYQSVCFESFENVYNTFYLEDGLVLHGTNVVDGGHSGKQSLELAAGDQFLIGDRDFIVPEHTGMIIKLWAKGVESGLSYTTGSYLDMVAQGDFTLLSRVGEWSLYQAEFNSGNYTKLQIRVDNDGANTIYIDDLRVQPVESQMSAYVYDADNLRLLAIFDDQHYGLFYHYNAEGKLVRKLLETERGTKTLQETFYNLPTE